jgi:hypothetical protein
MYDFIIKMYRDNGIKRWYSRGREIKHFSDDEVVRADEGGVVVV